MTNNVQRYQQMIERMDVGKRVERLQQELDGDPKTGAIGLRAALFATFRDLKAQERLLVARAEMQVPEAQAHLAKDDYQKADYQRRSLEAALDYLAGQIESVEDELAAASKIGAGPATQPVAVPQETPGSALEPPVSAVG